MTPSIVDGVTVVVEQSASASRSARNTKQNKAIIFCGISGLMASPREASVPRL